MGKHHRVVPLIPIAYPLAGHRLTKKIGNLITKCAESKQLVYGVKDTGKALRKNEPGITVLGGNVTPMDVITHIPGICEEKKQPFVFLPQKEQISKFAQRTSPVACVVIREPTNGQDYTEEYNEVVQEITNLANPVEQEEAE